MSSSAESSATTSSPEEYIVSPKEYMKDRVEVKIKGYTDAASKQRRRYWWISVVTIIVSATVPVLITLSKTDIVKKVDLTLVVTILSLIVTILVSVEKLFRFREHWRSYDGVAAKLHYEQLLFQTKAGVYSEKDAKQEKLFPLFVKRFEGLILEEKSLRIAMETEQDSGPKPPPTTS